MMRMTGSAALLLALSLAPAQADTPDRIVTVGGAVTEIVFALGAGNHVVAIDQTSTYPKSTHGLPDIGYVRNLAAEGLLSLKSDLVLAGPEAGPPQILDQVSGAGLKVVRLSPGYSPEITIEHIEEIGQAIDRKPEARALARTLARDMKTVTSDVAKAKSHPHVLFLLAAGRGAPMAGGRDTAADAMIRLAGGVNAFEDIQGYKPLSPEAAIVAKPDILVMMSQSVDALGGPDAVLALPEIAETPAARNKRLIVVDGQYSLGFGPRLAHATHDLAVAFHPDVTFTDLPDHPWTKAQ